MWLNLNAQDQSVKWTGVSGGQCSLQSCQQKLPAVTGKPNSILTSWHFHVEFMSEGWSWVFRLQSTTVLCLKKLWAGIDSYRVIYLWTPSLKGMEAEFSISLDYSGNLEWIQHFCVQDMTLWSESHGFSRGIICFTKVRKWDPSP